MVDNTANKKTFWTVARKLTLLVFIATTLIFAVFVFLVYGKMDRSLEEMAVEGHSSTAKLLGETVAPALRWKKIEKMQEAFDRASSVEQNSLNAFYVFGLPGSEQFTALFSIPDYSDNKSVAAMEEFAQEIKEEPQVADVGLSHIIVYPIRDARSDDVIGGIATAWDTRSIRATVHQSTKSLLWIAAVTVLSLAVFLSLLINRTVGRRIKDGVRVANLIAEGKLDNDIEASSSDELGELEVALNRVQESLVAGDDSERQAQEFGRIKQALDCASSPTLLADQSHQIVYVNESVKALFRHSDAVDLLTESPNLVNEALLGNSLDIFSHHPKLSLSAIDDLTKTRMVEIVKEDAAFIINVSPVVDDNGVRLGTILDFWDRSVEVVAERALQRSVDAAANGNFSERIDTSKLHGFHAQVAEMLNAMAEVTESGTNDTLKVLHALAVGDLNTQFRQDHSGIFAEIGENGEIMTNKLKEIVGQIRGAAVDVNEGAGSIANGTRDLSRRTEQQAAQLEETAAAMEELTDTVNQNAKNVKEASQLASHTREEAVRGGEVASRAVGAVREISEASEKIADIIGVIDEIAFQTNLLALNASVEAARAGDKGRGFAVVASEVRDLAGRSATAAKEIKELISDSVAKVQEGEKLVEESGEALNSIVDSVRKVSDIVSEITTAGEEQIQGISHVNNAISQIDQMTQKNALMVERQASASQEVGSQAQQLDKMVRYFKLDESSFGGSENIENTVNSENRAA